MRVLSVGYPLFPVAPDTSGGAEQILMLLDRELIRAGHTSYVVAACGSKVHGHLVETPALAREITEEDRQWARREHLAAISRVLSWKHFDLIHFHGLDFHAYVPGSDTPMLATLHLPLSWYPQQVLHGCNVHLNCVSYSEAAETNLPVIANGIDTKRYALRSTKHDYCLWLGRICPEKGVHLALQAARKAGRKLIVAGPVHPFKSHQEYFAEQVQPLLDEDRRYVGPIAGKQKEELLGSACCLLVTSLVLETSSLVAMEALSCGTPVVALRTGALPEVVEHGVTGYIVDNQEEIPSALGAVSRISPAVCRERAVRLFSAERMARDYLTLYKRILEMGTAPQEALYGSSPRRKFQPA